MDRLASILGRLPPIYTIEPGTLVHQLLSLVAAAMSTYDEDVDRVQRSHWLEQAWDREDLEQLGALVGAPGAPWEPDGLYRARLQATVSERLAGSVTRPALEAALARVLSAAQETMDVRYLEIPPQDADGSMFRPGSPERGEVAAFVEFPRATRRSEDLVARDGMLRPLDKFVAYNRGKDPAFLEGVIRGVAGGRTAMPLLVNLTTSTVVGYDGILRAGDELRLTIDGSGALHGSIGGVDVTRHLYTSSDFTPGTPFTPLLPDPSPRPILLTRGPNKLWFLSLALYDHPGLDAAMLSMATPEIEQGVFGNKAGAAGTKFDDSVFHQPPAVALDVFWDEHVPASFRVDIPAGAVRRTAGRRPQPEEDRVRLFGLLAEMVDELRAAAVTGVVRPAALAESQRMTDRCATPGASPREEAPTGTARLSMSALFDVTAVEGARFG